MGEAIGKTTPLHDVQKEWGHVLTGCGIGKAIVHGEFSMISSASSILLHTGSGIFFHSSQCANFLTTHPYLSRHRFLDICWLGLAHLNYYYTTLSMTLHFLMPCRCLQVFQNCFLDGWCTQWKFSRWTIFINSHVFLITKFLGQVQDLCSKLQYT
jgi:hypothetical protein